MSDEKNKNEKIEVVEGTGNLDISPVYDDISSMRPKTKSEKPKNIVVPKAKKRKKDEQESSDKA